MLDHVERWCFRCRCDNNVAESLVNAIYRKFSYVIVMSVKAMLWVNDKPAVNSKGGLNAIGSENQLFSWLSFPLFLVLSHQTAAVLLQ